jgi:predicted lipoprotein with Yx(FWY)xxD motif
MKRKQLIPTLMAALLMSATALAHSMDVKKVDGMLVSSSGMTVYTFDKDAAGSGKSACAGACTGLWPAVAATDANLKAPYGSIKREDGTMQLTYKGKPLYLYTADKKAGDKNGDNFKDVWHVVKD